MNLFILLPTCTNGIVNDHHTGICHVHDPEFDRITYQVYVMFMILNLIESHMGKVILKACVHYF